MMPLFSMVKQNKNISNHVNLNQNIVSKLYLTLSSLTSTETPLSETGSRAVNNNQPARSQPPVLYFKEQMGL
jgi:hypothetical protein